MADSRHRCRHDFGISCTTRITSKRSFVSAGFVCFSYFNSFFWINLGSDFWPPYNNSQLGEPIELADGSFVYDIVVVTDLDHDSKSEKEKNTWRSYMKRGVLMLNKLSFDYIYILFFCLFRLRLIPCFRQISMISFFIFLLLFQAQTKASVEWHEDSVVKLKSTLSSGGRSMELSDLKVFDGKLLTIDDRTGVVYR